MDTRIREMVARRCCIPGRFGTYVTDREILPGTKYVANTLDQDEKETLVIRTDAVDCLTFVEYTLAQALGSSFADNLQKIRYRDGIINGYPSRLHYTSEWIENGVRHGFLTDITAKNSLHTNKLALSYMSAHPWQYKKMADSPENVLQMAEHEKAISGKVVHWLPKTNCRKPDCLGL